MRQLTKNKPPSVACKTDNSQQQENSPFLAVSTLHSLTQPTHAEFLYTQASCNTQNLSRVNHQSISVHWCQNLYTKKAGVTPDDNGIPTVSISVALHYGIISYILLVLI